MREESLFPEKEKLKQVISASRRTDIPAFYLDWLIDGIKKGYVAVRNPYSGEERKVSLLPEDVHTIVLWSKDFGRFLKKRDAFSQFSLFFNFTVNDCPELEPNIPPLPERLRQVAELVRTYGSKRVAWRFDPVVFWDEGRKNNLKGFPHLCERMAELGIRRVIFSIFTLYKKVKARGDRLGINFYAPSPSERREVVEWMIEVAGRYRIALYACCSDDLLAIPGVNKAHCIDGKFLSTLSPEPCSLKKDKGQRRECGCTESIDIGDYERMPCLHNCLYCYANPKL
ncbi:MAG: DUF1848 domain-containing protein [Acidobacteria bacterium]|nr:DUF1848 domain-containing protein [Acidobacteriota bacterium]